MLGERRRDPERRASAALLALGILFASSAAGAQADSPHRLHWQSNWRRVNGVEYALTSGLFATFIAVWFLPPIESAIWTEPILIDDLTRRGLRARSRRGREINGGISDVLAVASYLPPLVIDPFIVAGIDDDNPYVAWQLLVISTQAYAITLTLNSISKRVFARERPYAVACAKDPKYSSSCTSADRFRSFYSGHSSITATGAGLICAHHTHLPLYGGGNYDRFTCLAALAGMAATGAMRIISDKHWHSDVVVGHLLGLSVGYLLPTLLYYGSFQSKPDPEANPGSSALPLQAPPLLAASFSF
jgi:membrane-associated phospholipid phosphatase